MTRTTYYFRILAAVAVAALGASVLLALVGPRAAEAAFPGKNGKIVYSAVDRSTLNYQIYTVPAGGGKPTKITKDATDHFAPSFSPDGKTIVYSASDGSNEQIYTVPAGGGKSTKVTTDATDHEDPTFSPDGKTIAYDAPDTSQNPHYFEIYTIPFPSSGETPTRVTSGTANHVEPAFSLDGKTIAYSGPPESSPFNTPYQIYTIPFPSSGATPTPLTNDSTTHQFPDFSPDGNTIVYSAPDSSNHPQLYTVPSVPPSGGGTATPTQLTNDAARHQDPAFSPDGTKLVYENGTGGLYMIPFPTSGATPTPVAAKTGGHSPNWGVSTGRHR